MTNSFEPLVIAGEMRTECFRGMSRPVTDAERAVLAEYIEFVAKGKVKEYPTRTNDERD